MTAPRGRSRSPAMPLAVPAWLRYHRRNRRDERMAGLWVAALYGVLPALLVHRLGPARAADLAAAARFDCERLPRNLTPSRRRYTCVPTARR